MYAIVPQAPRTRAAPVRPEESAPKVSEGDVADADAAANQATETDVRTLATLLAADRASRERDEILLDRQREAFDFMMKQRAELERERDALATLAMEQRKHDEEMLKEWIRLI